LIYI